MPSGGHLVKFQIFQKSHFSNFKYFKIEYFKLRIFKLRIFKFFKNEIFQKSKLLNIDAGRSTVLKRANSFRKTSSRTCARTSSSPSDGSKRAKSVRWRPTTRPKTERRASTSASWTSRKSTHRSRYYWPSVNFSFKFDHEIFDFEQIWTWKFFWIIWNLIFENFEFIFHFKNEWGRGLASQGGGVVKSTATAIDRRKSTDSFPFTSWFNIFLLDAETNRLALAEGHFLVVKLSAGAVPSSGGVVN